MNCVETFTFSRFQRVSSQSAAFVVESRFLHAFSHVSVRVSGRAWLASAEIPTAGATFVVRQPALLLHSAAKLPGVDRFAISKDAQWRVNTFLRLAPTGARCASVSCNRTVTRSGRTRGVRSTRRMSKGSSEIYGLRSRTRQKKPIG